MLPARGRRLTEKTYRSRFFPVKRYTPGDAIFRAKGESVPMTSNHSPYARLAALMRLAGVSHAAAARQIGLQRPALSLILAGKRPASPLVESRLSDLETALSAQAAEIVRGEVAHA